MYYLIVYLNEYHFDPATFTRVKGDTTVEKLYLTFEELQSMMMENRMPNEILDFKMISEEEYARGLKLECG